MAREWNDSHNLGFADARSVTPFDRFPVLNYILIARRRRLAPSLPYVVVPRLGESLLPAKLAVPDLHQLPQDSSFIPLGLRRRLNALAQ